MVDLQKALHNIDASQITPIKVDFTNLSSYCPVQNTFNTIIYLYDIKPNKGGAFFYYVQYVDCMERCYFVKCHNVPDGQLMVLYSMDLLFSVSIFSYSCEYERESDETVNNMATDDIMTL